MTKQQRITQMLENAGNKGLTVHEMMLKGGGNDVRKYISMLRRKGVPITDCWEKKGKEKWKRYFLDDMWVLN